ncbi:MAG: pyridoxamine 5'-phosphate oxidase [Actinomycetota bacterium]|nr:pyridoxamine 5'-phosphate oxidase [Actinomycetota bacterium]
MDLPAGPPDVAALRRSYTRAGLDEADLAPTWAEQFARWLSDAVAAGLREPNAVVLATADGAGVPSARTVLLKGYDDRGLVVFTNHGSRKGRDVAENPRAALVFPWLDVERQVVVAGAVERTSRAETEAYARSRPHGSQLGAWASPQSQVVRSRAVLEERRAALERKHPPGSEVPVPPHWGGLRVVPETVEFWQGRPDRLHDRLRYRREGEAWVLERLAP